MKYFVLISLFLIVLKVYASDKVELQSLSSVAVSATTKLASGTASDQSNCTSNGGTGSLSLKVVDPSGDAHQETSAVKVYIPILNTSSNSMANCMYLENSNSKISGSILKPLSRGTVASPTSTDYINFPLKLTVDSTRYLYAAVKDSSTYKIIKQFTITDSTSSTYAISPAEICLYATSVSDCSLTSGGLLEGSTSYVSSPTNLYVVFFLDSANYAIGDTAPTLSTHTVVYYNTYMSNRVFTSSIPSVSSVKVGDKRLVIDYSVSTQINSDFFSKIGVYSHTSTSSTNDPIGTYTGGSDKKMDGDFSTSQSGSATIYGLENSQSYILSVYFLDKFGFASPLSTSFDGTPLKIEELLKKQNCFLLTAGFGEEHFVIDYFRHFRDQTLSQYDLGQKFIKFYYKYAPAFALSIYNSESIRFVIRIFAYGLYYLMNNIAWSLIGLILIVGILVPLKKQKKFS